MSRELSDDAIPLAGFRIPCAVFSVRYQVQPVREAHLPRHRRQKVHAKTIKSRVPGVVFFLVHIRRLLRPIPHGIHARIMESALKPSRSNADLWRDTLAPTISRNFQLSRVSPSTHSSKMGGTSGAGVKTIKHSALRGNLPRFACIFFYFRQHKLLWIYSNIFLVQLHLSISWMKHVLW